MAIQLRNRNPIPVREELSREWGELGFSFGLWIDPPGQEWLDFLHGTDEILLLAQGRLKLEVDGESAELAPGDEVLIPAGASHSVCNIGDMEARWYYGYRRDEQADRAVTNDD